MNFGNFLEKWQVNKVRCPRHHHVNYKPWWWKNMMIWIIWISFFLSMNKEHAFLRSILHNSSDSELLFPFYFLYIFCFVNNNLFLFCVFAFCLELVMTATSNYKFTFCLWNKKTWNKIFLRVFMYALNAIHTVENQNSNYFNSFGYNNNSTHSNNNHAATANTQWSVWQQFPWPYIQPEQNRWSKCCFWTRTHTCVRVCRFVSSMCRSFVECVCVWLFLYLVISCTLCVCTF